MNLDLGGNLAHSMEPKDDAIFYQRDYDGLLRNVAVVIENATKLELTSTLASATHFKDVLENCPDASKPNEYKFAIPDVLRFIQTGKDISARCADECGGRLFQEVFDAFPSASEDISEAGTCLALERSVATVFHLMRALETVVQVVANRLEATIADQHGRTLPWGVIASNMKPKIDKLPTGSDEQIKWYRIQSYLIVLNRAWRAPTAHPKQTYTPEEARKVFDATKAFMQELAPFA